jgi:inner membrane protein
MPSPIGHALGGMAFGWAIAPRLRDGVARAGAIYAAVGMAPDLDLLVGSHSTYTHSVGAVGLVFLAGLAASRRPRVAAAIAAAWASHLLLDWLGNDTSAPIGIMALWPFSREHYQSSFYVFEAISRRYWLPEQFVWSNLKAALREVLILGPVAGVSYWMTYVNHGATRNTENAQDS